MTKDKLEAPKVIEFYLRIRCNFVHKTSQKLHNNFDSHFNVTNSGVIAKNIIIEFNIPKCVHSVSYSFKNGKILSNLKAQLSNSKDNKNKKLKKKSSMNEGDINNFINSNSNEWFIEVCLFYLYLLFVFAYF